MPRVTEEYRTARRNEIIVAAGNLFARNGFHATSMADTIAATGLSAGAVYRYFRSKEELIGAVAQTVLETADEIFGRLLAEEPPPPPARAVATVIEQVLSQESTNGVDLPRMALQVWAEAVRSPELSERANEAFTRLRGRHAEVARRWQAAGHLPADADPLEVGAAMLGLAQGFLIQNLLVPGTTTAGYIAGMNVLLGQQPAAGAAATDSSADQSD